MGHRVLWVIVWRGIGGQDNRLCGVVDQCAKIQIDVWMSVHGLVLGVELIAKWVHRRLKDAHDACVVLLMDESKNGWVGLQQ